MDRLEEGETGEQKPKVPMFYEVSIKEKSRTRCNVDASLVFTFAKTKHTEIPR